MLRTLNLFFERHRGVKVFAIASMFRVLFVRNLVAMINSGELSSSSREQPGPSLSDNVKRFQLVVKSSMMVGEKNNQKTYTVSQQPLKGTQQALE